MNFNLIRASTLALTALILGALAAASAQAEKPRFPYRTLPADIVVLKELPPSPEPQLLRMAAGPRPGSLHGADTRPQAVVDSPDGSGCTGPRPHLPGRPSCPAAARR